MVLLNHGVTGIVVVLPFLHLMLQSTVQTGANSFILPTKQKEVARVALT